MNHLGVVNQICYWFGFGIGFGGRTVASIGAIGI